jgi:hypothetical protein
MVSMVTHRPFGADGECTNLTANRNWIAHTRRQQRFSERVNAHNANVTSYTTANSSGALVAGADIFSKNSNANNARSKLTRHNKAKDVSASSVAARVLLFRAGAVRFDANPGAFPLAIFGGDTTGIGPITGIGGATVGGGCAPGLTLAEVPPTECLEESNVETLRARWWCGRRGMFW